MNATDEIPEGLTSQRRDESAGNAAETDVVDISDSPLPPHSHPADAQQRSLVVPMCGCVLLPGFSSYNESRETKLTGKKCGNAPGDPASQPLNQREEFGKDCF